MNITLSVNSSHSLSFKEKLSNFSSSCAVVAKKVCEYALSVFKMMAIGVAFAAFTYLNPSFVVVGCLAGVYADKSIVNMIQNIKNIWKSQSIIIKSLFVFGAFVFLPETVMVTCVLFPAYHIANLSLSSKK